MRPVDRAFAITLAAFAAGSTAGIDAVLGLPPLQPLIGSLLETRMLTPVTAVSAFGDVALVLLIFANNSVPVLLSFLWPFILGKVCWTPPLAASTMGRLLGAYTVLVAFLVGFFDLGATLGWAWLAGGDALVSRLLVASWLHGPFEFLFVLLAVSEPLRLTSTTKGYGDLVAATKKDWKLALACLAGLLLTAVVEVLMRS